MHVGTEMEEVFAKDAVPDPSGNSHPELKCVLQLVEKRRSLAAMRMRMVKHCKGVAEETTKD